MPPGNQIAWRIRPGVGPPPATRSSGRTGRCIPSPRLFRTGSSGWPAYRSSIYVKSCCLAAPPPEAGRSVRQSARSFRCLASTVDPVAVHVECGRRRIPIDWYIDPCLPGGPAERTVLGAFQPMEARGRGAQQRNRRVEDQMRTHPSPRRADRPVRPYGGSRRPPPASSSRDDRSRPGRARSRHRWSTAAGRSARPPAWEECRWSRHWYPRSRPRSPAAAALIESRKAAAVSRGSGRGAKNRSANVEERLRHGDAPEAGNVQRGEAPGHFHRAGRLFRRHRARPPGRGVADGGFHATRLPVMASRRPSSRPSR